MPVRYRYRLKPEIERKIREARRIERERWLKHVKPGEYSAEDLKLTEEIDFHLMPGVDPESLLELAQKIKNPDLRERYIKSIKLYFYERCIPVPNEWVEGASNLPIFF